MAREQLLHNCRHGTRQDVIDTIAEFGADILSDLFDDAEREACRAGNIAVAEYLYVNKYAYNGYEYDRFDLSHALEHNHIEIVKFLIDRTSSDIPDALIDACKGGNFDIIVLIYEKFKAWYHGANSSDEHDMTFAVEYLCERGYLDTFKLLLKTHYSQVTQMDVTAFCVGACRGGRLDILKYLLSRYPMPTYTHNMPDYFVISCQGNNHDLISFILESVETISIEQCDQSFINACRAKDIKIMKLLCDKHIPPQITLNNCIRDADDINVIKFLLAYGANPAQIRYNCSAEIFKFYLTLMKFQVSPGSTKLIEHILDMNDDELARLFDIENDCVNLDDDLPAAKIKLLIDHNFFHNREVLSWHISGLLDVGVPHAWLRVYAGNKYGAMLDRLCSTYDMRVVEVSSVFPLVLSKIIVGYLPFSFSASAFSASAFSASAFSASAFSASVAAQPP